MDAELPVPHPHIGKWDQLYLEHIEDAVTLGYLLTGDQDLAQDLTHDAFVRVGGRLRIFQNPHGFRAYLRRTVVNLCRDHFRRLRRMRKNQGFLSTKRTVEIPDIESRDALWLALMKLSARKRAALVLHYYQDLPAHEIADILGCSVSGAQTLILRGLASLRKDMEERHD